MERLLRNDDGTAVERRSDGDRNGDGTAAGTAVERRQATERRGTAAERLRRSSGGATTESAIERQRNDDGATVERLRRNDGGTAQERAAASRSGLAHS